MSDIASLLTPSAVVFVSAVVLVIGAVVLAFFFEYRGYPTAFDFLFMLAMLASLANLIFIAVQAFRGVFQLSDVVLAVISGAVSGYCIFFGIWGITEGAEGADEVRRDLAKEQHMSQEISDDGTLGIAE